MPAREDAAWPWDRPPICLVTGSAQGLGRAVAGALARRGATVVLSARDHAKAAEAAAQLADAGDLQPLPGGLDVADRASVDAAATALADLRG